MDQVEPSIPTTPLGQSKLLPAWPLLFFPSFPHHPLTLINKKNSWPFFFLTPTDPDSQNPYLPMPPTYPLAPTNPSLLPIH